jgi:hypothetical protein
MNVGAAVKRMEKLLLDSKKHEIQKSGKDYWGISINLNQMPHQ